MTAVALLFAIYGQAQPILCVDELTSLDESIHRFIKVLQGLIAKSHHIIHTTAPPSARQRALWRRHAETGISRLSLCGSCTIGKLEPAKTSEKTDASQTEPANAITAER